MISYPTVISFVGLLLILVAVGCSRQDHTQGTSSPQPNWLLRFEDSEIRTKTWKYQDRDIVLLSLEVMRFTNRADLLIAKYGVSESGITNCLDFYVSYPTPSNEPPFFLLVAHDYQSGSVDRVSGAEEKGRVFIDVERVYSSLGDRTLGRSSYSYEYSTNNCLLKGESTIITPAQ